MGSPGGDPNEWLDRLYPGVKEGAKTGGMQGIKDYLHAQGMADSDMQHVIDLMFSRFPSIQDDIDFADAQRETKVTLEQQKRFLDSVLPNSEIQPQSVADRRLEEYLFSSREGAVIDDMGNMTNKGTLYPGLNVPQGTLPAPMSTISPRIDLGTRDQMAFMQQAKPGTDGNFGAATPTQPRNVGTPPSNGAYYGGQLAPPPPEGYQPSSLMARPQTSNQLQGQPMTNNQMQSGQSGHGPTDSLSSPNK